MDKSEVMMKNKIESIDQQTETNDIAVCYIINKEMKLHPVLVENSGQGKMLSGSEMIYTFKNKNKK